MKVLGIETTCDDTAVAIYDDDQGIIAHTMASQIALHQQYGGVVPELASRDHIRHCLPRVELALKQANCKRSDLDGIAYSAGPGLIGAVLVGACFARSFAWGLAIPSIGVHHLEAHLLAVMLEKEQPSFPFVALLVSGGHTQLMEVSSIGHYRLLGETLDDAAGEAFDKTAKLLGLDYPGGPEIARIAKNGDKRAFAFARPMTDRPNLNFSFSGLKTQVRRAWQASDQSEATQANIAASFQHAMVETLVIKCQRALEGTQHNQLVVAGGVSANQLLRQRMTQILHEKGIRVYYPRHEFCTDNGAMVAYAGYRRLQLGDQDDLCIKAKARWPLGNT